MKKLATAVSTIGLFAAAVLPAFATAGNNCGNDTTGPFSTNYCDIKNEASVSVENNNSAKIKNDVTGDVNTGGNFASYNTLGGHIVSGDASGETTVSNMANVNTNMITTGNMGGSNDGSNDTTGPFSDNRVDISNRQKVDVENNNDAYVKNHVDVTSNTGDNNADFNTGPATIDTGDAWSKTAVTTHVNDNLTEISTGGQGWGRNDATNDITGPFSTDYVTIKNKTITDVDNYNDADVKNHVDVASLSGDNSTSYDTLGGAIHTGSTGAKVGVNNEGNVNTTHIMSAMGGFSNLGGTEISGPESDNRSEIVNKMHTDVSNMNDAYLMNYVDVVSDTGDNAGDYNTAGGYIHTGMGSMLQSIMSHFNDSLTEIM